MWIWAISAIAASILGNAADSWFAETKLGIWFYRLEQLAILTKDDGK
jgi:hypothetical protein